MRRTLSYLILGCLFLFVTFNMTAALAEDERAMAGPQTARIIVPKAIVYADENMNSPLGYIAIDKLITVGAPRRKNPELVPLVVYGRLAFIEIKNIHYENDSMEELNAKRGAPKEHNIDVILAKPEEKLSENNSAYLSVHTFYAGEETNALFEKFEGSGKDRMIGFDFSLLHRQTPGRIIWGASLDYSSLSGSNMNFDFSMVNLVLGYTPIRNPLFLVDLYASADFSLYTRLKIDTNYLNEPAPFIFGPQLSSRIVFFPNQKYHLNAQLTYKSYKVTRIEDLTDSNGRAISGITKTQGLNFAVGIGMEL